MIDLSKVGKPTGIKGVYSCEVFDPAAIEDYRIPSRVTVTADGKIIQSGRAGYVVRVMEAVQSVGVNPRKPGVYYFSTTAMFVSYPGFACVWPPRVEDVTEVRTAGDEHTTPVADPASIPQEVRDGVGE